MADFTFEKATGGEINVTARTVTHRYRAYHVPDVLPGGDFFSYVAQVALASCPPVIFEPSMGSELYRQNIQVHENYYARDYEITVPYGVLKKESGAYQIRVSIGGGTVNVKAGTRQGGYGTAGGGLGGDEGTTTGKVDNGGLIGVDGDRVTGTDIPVESMAISVLFRHPKGSLNRAYIQRIKKLVGHPNNDEFLGFEPGEVRFAGGDFTETETEATAQYDFDVSPNTVESDGLEVGGISITEKKGWDVISPVYKRDTDNNFGVRKIQYIEIIRPAGREFKDYTDETGFGWGGSPED